MKKKLSRFASDLIIRHFVLPIMHWASDVKGAFFFLVIGDENMTDVAWANTEDLACDGAITVSSDPEAAGAFLSLETGVDILLEDMQKKNPDFDQQLQQTSPKSNDRGWLSLDNYREK